jgi:hypothetical protein
VYATEVRFEESARQKSGKVVLPGGTGVEAFWPKMTAEARKGLPTGYRDDPVLLLHVAGKGPKTCLSGPDWRSSFAVPKHRETGSKSVRTRIIVEPKCQ